MLGQSDDLTPEEFKRRYDAYCVGYVHNFADAFFDASKDEEWFQNRYNPVCRQQIERDAEQWAWSEAKIFKSEVDRNPVAAVKAVCLDPPPAVPAAPALPVVAVSNSTESKSSVDGEEAPRVEESVALSAPAEELSVLPTNVSSLSAAEEEPRQEEFYGKHLRGHTDRTVYIAGIHSSCTKQTLVSNIHYLLSSAKLPAPERILLSSPVWGPRHPSKFEK